MSAGAVAGLAGCQIPDGSLGGGAAQDCTEELAGEVTEDRTLDCATYRVTDDLRVAAGATLRFVPGVTLSFAPETGLTVDPGGSLRTTGDDGASVTFTGERERPGSWRGIEYEGPDDGVGDLVLHNVVLEYAGSGDRAALEISGATESGTVSITDGLVRKNAGTGVGIASGVGVDAFEGNRITGNGGTPIACTATVVDDLATDNEFAGNDDDAVAVEAATVETPATWTDLGVPYRIDETPTVASHLTVESGTTVEFDRSQGLRVVESGALTATGEPDSPVTFTGRSADPGYWAGLWFEDSDREENRLENVVVEYGGGLLPSFAEAGANVVVDGENGQSIAIDDSVVRASASNGVAFGQAAQVRSFEGNELVDNGSNPGRLSPEAAAAVPADTVLSNNGQEPLVVAAGGVPKETEVRWSPLEVPYRVEGELNVAGTLEFGPGATVEFAPDAGVGVPREGTLVAGGGDESTVLTGTRSEPGGWDGVWITDDATGRFENAVLEYAGGDSPPFATDRSALAVGGVGDDGDDGDDGDEDGRSPTLVLKDSVVRNSGGDGLYLGAGTTVEAMQDSALVENERRPASVHASMLPAVDPETTFEDNGDSAVAVRGEGDELVGGGETYSLPALETAYRFFGSTVVRGELAVDPGAVLEFGPDADLRVLDGGTLTAEGTDDDRITFRGESPTAGYWRGILVRDSTASFEHAEINHGGGGDRPLPDAEYRASVAVTTSSYQKRATLSLTDVRVARSDAYALYIGHFTTVDPENVTVLSARKRHNAEAMDHEPHPIGPSNPHDED
jgi:hypothetical protein